MSLVAKKIRWPRGALLNAGSVAAGALLGLALGSTIPPSLLSVVLNALGLVTIGLGIKMFLGGKNLLLIAGCLAIGGVIGTVMGIDRGLAAFAEGVRERVGGGGKFNEGLITTSILFCVGPMTLLGCLKDGLEGDMELLALKSVLDGIGAIFFAAALGAGVLVTAFVVLIVQSSLTLAARWLEPLAKDQEMIHELSAVGGTMLLAIGLGLAEIRKYPSENYLPALVLCPLVMVVMARVGRRKTASLPGNH